MKIVNFGSCNVDYVYSLDSIVIPGETKASEFLEVFPGGKGLNQSIAAAKAGADVCHVGLIGEDGSFLRDVLTDGGVDTSYLDEVGVRSGHAIIQVSKNGQNSIILYAGANHALTEEKIDSVIRSLSGDDIVMLQNETNLVDHIIDKAYEAGLRIVFNPAPFSENLCSIDCDKITYLILNEVEIQGLGGKDSVEDALCYLSSKYKKTNIILTLGGDGCAYIENGEVRRSAAYDVTAVDTTAAGDTFIGYFVAEISRGGEVSESVSIAQAAAALSVTKMGASVSIPSREQVIEAMVTLKQKVQNDNTSEIKERIDRYIEENLADATLASLAESLSYSTSYVSRKIRDMYGESFTDHIKNMRCDKAAELLSKGDLSVEEVMSVIGYENSGFFTKIFRERFGVAPHKYKTMKKGKSNG